VSIFIISFLFFSDFLVTWDVFKVCQWLTAGRWFSPGTPVSSTNKTDCQDKTEILLKVPLNTINQNNLYCIFCTLLYLLYLYNRLIYYLILILVNTITAGQLLCGGLFSTDSLSNWFAAVALLHAVYLNTIWIPSMEYY
jgi:hypothetical protein